MECKYLFGSKMLKLNNCRDEDWITFVDEKSRDKVPKLYRYKRIPFYNTIVQHFTEGKNQPDDAYKSTYLFQLSCGFFEGDESYPFKHFNILEHKKVWIEQLKGYMNHSTTEQFALKGETLNKTFYHVLYQYYMIVENTHFISEEAKVDVQKIHDYKMPTSYFYELKDKINNL